MTTTTIKKRVEEERFEFVLHINNKIICQRFFNIRNYNENALKSSDMKDLMDTLTGMDLDGIGSMGLIPAHLKNKSVDYMWEIYNPYYVKPIDGSLTPLYQDNNFQLEIKIDKETVAKSQFSGLGFLSSKVDIKEIIPSIINEIRITLSRRNYEPVLS